MKPAFTYPSMGHKQSQKIIFFILFTLIFSGIMNSAALAESKADLSSPFKQKGLSYLQSGKHELAINEYEKAIAFDSKSTATYFNLAIAYYGVRNIEGATQALERLIEIEPNDVEALYNLACLKLYKQDCKKAKIYFEKARECCAKNPEFEPLITKGLEFLDRLMKDNPSTQDLVLFFLAQGLPPIVVGG